VRERQETQSERDFRTIAKDGVMCCGDGRRGCEPGNAGKPWKQKK
jgi:hypothetical protein